MPGVRNLHAFWQEALATLLPAAIENLTAVLRLHAGAESELAFAGALRGLIGAFHRPWRKSGFAKRGRRIAGHGAVSTKRVENFHRGGQSPWCPKPPMKT